ncbi:MAG TPA: HEAT repeat domain-containing protein [Gemmataceae bacterium]|nr:HEAT repeat domain-containing protein [Gemmataceae bacterium]
MHSRKQAAWDEQRQQQDQQNQPKHGLLEKTADCNGPRIIIPDSPVMRPTLLERIFHRKKQECVTTVCEGTPVAPPKVEEKKAETKTMPNAAVEPPKPVDNRQSWGKYEPIEPVLPGKTTRPTSTTKSPKPDTTSEKASASTPAKPLPDVELPHARPTKGGDPLTHPEGYSKFPSEPVHEIPEVKHPAPAKKDAGTRPVLPPPPPLTPSPLPAAPSEGDPQARKHPPGSASVLAAGEAQYVPVPIMTVPTPRPAPVPPTPPMPQVPEAPALNRMVNGPSAGGTPPSGMTNAFTSPGPSKPIPSENMPSDLAVNAFSGPAPAQNAPPTPPTPNQGMPNQAMAGGYPPVPPMANPAMAGGYPQGAPMPNPALAGGYPPRPGGYAPPLPPPNMPMMPPPPPFAPASYYHYAAPVPGVMTPPSAPGYSQAQQGAGATLSVPQLLQMLRDSDFPSQRESAAELLGGVNGRSSPEAVQALVTAAKADPAAMVRVCCIRSLMKMQANTVPVVTAVQELKNDPDPRVRDAVGEALTAFGVAPAAPGSSSIQPVGH